MSKPVYTCSRCGRATSLPTVVNGANYHLNCAPPAAKLVPSELSWALLRGDTFSMLPGTQTY